MRLIIEAGHLRDFVLRHLVRSLHAALVQHNTPQQYAFAVLSCHGLGQVRHPVRHAGGADLVTLYVAESLGAVFRHKFLFGYQRSDVHIAVFGLHEEGTYGLSDHRKPTL